MAKATASPPARRRSGDRPRGKAKTPKYKTKETSPPKHESAWKHEINRGFIAPFLLTRSVHFHAAIWHNLSPPLTAGSRAPRSLVHMAPEAARALDQKVDRSEIGNDQVKIEIEGLFNHLRCDENARPYNLRRTAKFFQD